MEASKTNINKSTIDAKVEHLAELKRKLELIKASNRQLAAENNQLELEISALETHLRANKAA